MDSHDFLHDTHDDERSPMKKLITTAAIIAAAVGIALPATANARSYTIEINKYQVTQLGPLKTSWARNYEPNIGEAINAFGKPSSRFEKQGGCVVKWQQLGLRIQFRNYGWREGKTICHANVGLVQSFHIRQSRKWRTKRGLRIGTSEYRLMNLYPGAEWNDVLREDNTFTDGWWLQQGWTNIGDGGFYPILAASVGNDDRNRVKMLYGWVGAAGE
jgi:hypothetical protein